MMCHAYILLFRLIVPVKFCLNHEVRIGFVSYLMDVCLHVRGTYTCTYNVWTAC